MPFVDGTTVERSYTFGKDIVQALGDVSVEGSSLTIANLALYGAGSARLSLGTGPVLSMYNSLADEAGREGFFVLTVSGMRYSRANPGRLVTITRRLAGD